MTRPAAVLDANVRYPARLRDLFLRLAIAGLFRARWTERILDELFANLSADRPDIPAESLRRTRRPMAVAIPDAVITDYDHLIDQLDLPDPDDRRHPAPLRRLSYLRAHRQREDGDDHPCGPHRLPQPRAGDASPG